MEQPKKTSHRRLWLAIGIAAVVIIVVLPILAVFGLINSQTGLPITLQQKAASNSSGIAITSAPMMGEAGVSYGGRDMMADEAVAPGMPSPIMPPVDMTGGQTAAEVDQKIIKNASLELVVNDAAKSAAQISALAEERGGFTQNSSISERIESQTKFGQVTVRVPTEKFEDLLDAIRPLATVIRNESISGQDVTEQYTDLEARLKNAQAQEQTYLAVLDRAKTVEDILKVQAQLGQIRETIERYQGQLKYLTNLTSYSTVSVSLSEEPVITVAGREFRPGTAVKEAVQALVNVAQNAVIAVIWLVILFGGALVPPALLVWFIVWAIRRRRKSKK
ncbi:MAG: DUF4349 domain-containing protein [Patescibacteria group bacterium]|nr:DUF4349 domain-containing protein [Patescibacteria group bacterium]